MPVIDYLLSHHCFVVKDVRLEQTYVQLRIECRQGECTRVQAMGSRQNVSLAYQYSRTDMKPGSPPQGDHVRVPSDGRCDNRPLLLLRHWAVLSRCQGTKPQNQ